MRRDREHAEPPTASDEALAKAAMRSAILSGRPRAEIVWMAREYKLWAVLRWLVENPAFDPSAKESA